MRRIIEGARQNYVYQSSEIAPEVRPSLPVDMLNSKGVQVGKKISSYITLPNGHSIPMVR